MQPADGAVLLHVPDGEPDTGQPMSDQSERAHQQEEHGRAVLRVTVQFTCHSHQTQKTRRLEQPDQGGLLSRLNDKKTN